MSIDSDARGKMSMLIYPILFERNALDGVDRAIQMIVKPAETDEYVASITAALESSDQLSGLIPNDHSEPAIRAYLAEVRRRLQKPA